ncbi:uncharacterized protein LOC110245529 [Exaiptasia diaphana]|uniref:Uncharacterized protein n=1 Tax=Exaiptasia diaphana TaxID=2652724 RepID=A0A913XP38_EXADI|nr:uncharacterized protein LOC110245529 [Exaiptasia diaphana]
MYLSLVCVFGLLAVTSGSYQTQPIIGAASYTEKVPEGGRSPTDDKRYTIEQLNRAARHRNVYMDRAGGDPYGVSSPMVARGKRSVGTQQLYPVGSDFHAKPKPMYARKQMNIEEKRNYIGWLNMPAPALVPLNASPPLPFQYLLLFLLSYNSCCTSTSSCSCSPSSSAPPLKLSAMLLKCFVTYRLFQSDCFNVDYTEL